MALRAAALRAVAGAAAGARAGAGRGARRGRGPGAERGAMAGAAGAGAPQCNLLVLGDRAANPELAALDALPEGVRVARVARGDALLTDCGEEALADVDAVLVCVGAGRREMQAAWPALRASGRLRWVHSTFAGLDHFLFPELAAAPGVAFTNARGVFSHSLAEFVIFACKYFALDFPRAMAAQGRREWAPYTVEELRGQTLGVVGMGSIGAQTARLASAFGMRVVGLRRSGAPAEGVARMYGADELPALMAESDYVVACLPYTDATDGYIDAKAISAMRSNAVFVNVGRGKTVDEAALVEALREKRIRGAALDVVREEPMPSNNELWELPNVIITPHCADSTAVMAKESIELFVENAGRFVEGRELLNTVDPAAGY